MSKCTRCGEEMLIDETDLYDRNIQIEYKLWGHQFYVCNNESCPNYGNLTFASKK